MGRSPGDRVRLLAHPPAPDVRALLVWNKDGAYSALSRAPFFTVHEEIYVLGDGWELDDELLPCDRC